MARPDRWTLAALLLFLPLAAACADEPDTELIEEEDAVEAVEEEGTLEVPPDESAAGAAFDVEERTGLGRYLADRDSRAVYLFTRDADVEGSACSGECAEMWPPVIAQGGSPAAAGPDVRADLLGTIQRPDGRTQATYAGHPLYYYVGDSGPGEITGQDLHTHEGEWYLVTPAGEPLEGEG